eukprot:3044456-Rhodomonas_salina.1
MFDLRSALVSSALFSDVLNQQVSITISGLLTHAFLPPGACRLHLLLQCLHAPEQVNLAICQQAWQAMPGTDTACGGPSTPLLRAGAPSAAVSGVRAAPAGAPRYEKAE